MVKEQLDIEVRKNVACHGLPPRLAVGLALLQEKWALAIIYALLRGPVGFNALSRTAGAVNPTTLAQRLARLEDAGVIRKKIHSTMPPRTSYELTERGMALKPVIESIEQWVERHVPYEEKCADAAAPASESASAPEPKSAVVTA